VNQRLGLIIDQERCIGCEACTVACIKENRGQSSWIKVLTIDSPHKDTPTGTFPNLSMHFLPTLCNHCQQPPCADACPLAAIVKSSNGPVLLDEEKCDGCQACLDACPYGAINFSDAENKAEKCNLCIHRIEKGLEPFCVICCEGQAIHFGNINDPDSTVAQLFNSGESFCLQPREGTDPAVHYLPPKKPRGL
jgi:Fe-S-cluster-containing dehydrogenase component